MIKVVPSDGMKEFFPNDIYPKEHIPEHVFCIYNYIISEAFVFETLKQTTAYGLGIRNCVPKLLMSNFELQIINACQQIFQICRFPYVSFILCNHYIEKFKRKGYKWLTIIWLKILLTL